VVVIELAVVVIDAAVVGFVVLVVVVGMVVVVDIVVVVGLIVVLVDAVVVGLVVVDVRCFAQVKSSRPLPPLRGFGCHNYWVISICRDVAEGLFFAQKKALGGSNQDALTR